ncbi:hypothetical protein ACA910_010256 [Epithemia clementina (nom. ined.)]
MSSSSSSFSIKDLYLLAYNGACCLGWAGVLVLAVLEFCKTVVGSGVGAASAALYGQAPNLAFLLTAVQSAAVLEIVHAAVGLVRSPALVTAMQVSSRLVALYALVHSSQAQEQWGAGLMILSWSLVEVPRYAFYFMALLTGDATMKTPFPLFWLRYSLFAVLYPSGITGELTVFFSAASDAAFANAIPGASIFYGTLLPIIYFFGSPFMIFNMVGNRKSAFKKRFAKPPPAPLGLCWPVDDKGERSSTKVNQAILAAAVGAVNTNKAQAILRSRKWRFDYWKHLQALVEEQCASPEAALKIAQAGLDRAYELFEFVAPDGSTQSFKDTMAQPKDTKNPFYTMTIQGKSSTPKVEQCQVPYKGDTLSGDKLKQQVQVWVDYGTIEPSAGRAIMQCVDHPEYIKETIAKQSFVLLGAGSAMGPLLVLLSLGATVVAIDLDRPPIWQRLISLVRNSQGTLIFPVNVKPETLKTDEDICAHAGCNLFTQTPRIRDWLLEVQPGRPLTVGSYAYLNGALHVQVSLAMDAICRDLMEKRGSNNISLAYLCTPTDLHLIPKEAHDAALENYKEFQQKLYCALFQMIPGGKYLRKNALPPIRTGDGKDELYLVNGVSVAQGPNYILAKRLQHWRAIIALYKGHLVSSNIAPSTSTLSVVQNRTFAWAYEGMPYFRPYEIFAPETSNAVMSAILLTDLNTQNAKALSVGLVNPNQLFSTGAFHGGTWRCAYTIDSIGEASVFLYFGRLAAQSMKKDAPYLIGAAAAVVGAIYYGMGS